jgi:uncharacterized protein Smg (DUF494 family)
MSEAMRDRILEIVLLLIDFMQQNRGAVSDIDDISSALEMEGFSEREISAAYAWLVKRYGSWPECLYEHFPGSHMSNRVLTAAERRRMSPEAHGFLIKLLHLKLVDDAEFEDILEGTAARGAGAITLEDIKLLASSVVFQDSEESAGLNLFDPSDDNTSTFVN